MYNYIYNVRWYLFNLIALFNLLFFYTWYVILYIPFTCKKHSTIIFALSRNYNFNQLPLDILNTFVLSKILFYHAKKNIYISWYLFKLTHNLIKITKANIDVSPQHNASSTHDHNASSTHDHNASSYMHFNYELIVLALMEHLFL